MSGSAQISVPQVLQRLDFVPKATTRQNMSSGVSDQARHKPACAATEATVQVAGSFEGTRILRK